MRFSRGFSALELMPVVMIFGALIAMYMTFNDADKMLEKANKSGSEVSMYLARSYKSCWSKNIGSASREDCELDALFKSAKELFNPEDILAAAKEIGFETTKYDYLATIYDDELKNIILVETSVKKDCNNCTNVETLLKTGSEMEMYPTKLQRFADVKHISLNDDDFKIYNDMLTVRSLTH